MSVSNTSCNSIPFLKLTFNFKVLNFPSSVINISFVCIGYFLRKYSSQQLALLLPAPNSVPTFFKIVSTTKCNHKDVHMLYYYWQNYSWKSLVDKGFSVLTVDKIFLSSNRLHIIFMISDEATGKNSPMTKQFQIGFGGIFQEKSHFRGGCYEIFNNLKRKDLKVQK